MNYAFDESLDSYVQAYILTVPFRSSPSFLRDTNHFLWKLADLIVPANSFLVPLDVEALYTNIAHEDSIAAVTEFSVQAHKTIDLDCQSLTALIRLVLEWNNFELADKH